MRIVEQTVSAGGAIFDLAEFLARPLFAHLAHDSGRGPGRPTSRALEVARGRGVRVRVPLVTPPSMTEAIATCRAPGLATTGPFCRNPVAGELFFARSPGPRRVG